MNDDNETTTDRASFDFHWRGLALTVHGDAELIRESFTLLREDLLPQVVTAGPAEEPATATEQLTSLTSRPAPTRTEGAPTPQEYFEEKKPQTEQEKATVLATYAKLYRNQSEFTVSDLEELHNEALAKIKNVQNAIWNSGRKSIGWIKVVTGKRGYYSVTPAGENFVKTQLPKN